MKEALAQNTYPPWTCPRCKSLGLLIFPPLTPTQTQWFTCCTKCHAPALTAPDYESLVTLVCMELELH